MMERIGALAALEHLPSVPQLIVLNYHRIGRREGTEFDPDPFSVDADAFDSQISALRRRYAIIGEAEAVEVINKVRPRTGTAVLLTFDDGYLDNLQVAVPVLRSHGVKGLFFLVTDYLRNPAQLTWWDRIAWLVRQCRGQTIRLTRPIALRVTIKHDNMTAAIRDILRIYRSASLQDCSAIEAELEACAGKRGPATFDRQLMNWEEARQLRLAGMDIGAHTHSHNILSKLSLEHQRAELALCAELIEDNVGARPRTLAYPVGSRQAFDGGTRKLAEELGFEAAFSFYGGTNVVGQIDRFDVRRVALADDADATRTRAAIALLRTTRSVWW
jgi:peptidoglycan/xylan/chitin deacetylase (PgdA/CDA1 family)